MPKKIDPKLILQRKLLKQARRLVKAGWTQNTMSRDKAGNEVMLYSRKAATFCMLGSLQRSFFDLKVHKLKRLALFVELRERLAVCCDPDECDAQDAVVNFNDADERSQKEVIGIFDCAIKSVKS